MVERQIEKARVEGEEMHYANERSPSTRLQWPLWPHLDLHSSNNCFPDQLLRLQPN